MEWVLQVVDELDDAFCALRFSTLCWIEEMGLVLACGAAACAVYAALLRSVP